MPPTAEVEVAIVGAGIAGLAAAWALRDRDLVVLEAGDRVGGRILSVSRPPYWLNLAAHVFPPPETALGRLITEVGLETTLIPGDAMAVWLNGKLASRGRPETYPLRLPLSLRGRMSLVSAGLKIRRTVPEYLKLASAQAGEPPADVRARLLAYRGDTTFADFLGPLDPDVSALFRAATNRASAEPEQLSAGAGVAHFAAVFSGGSSLYMRNIIGGSSRLPDALAIALGDRLILGAHVQSVTPTHVQADTPARVQADKPTRVQADKPTRVRAVTPTSSRVEINYAQGGKPHSLIAKQVVVATPAFVTRDLVEGLDADAVAALGTVPYGPYVVAALLTGEHERMPWDDIYAIAVSGKSFNMFFNTVNALRGGGERQPGGSLMVYGASNAARALLELSDSEVQNRFYEDLHDLFPVLPGIVEECVVQRWEKGIPYTAPGRHLVQPTLERLARTVSLAGDYLGERGGMEIAALSGIEAAGAVRSRLERVG
jgi:protoporphyrinogen/coproporphyrinogen III oxidase